MQDLVLEIQQRLVSMIDNGDCGDAKVALTKLKELSEQLIELEDDLAIAQMVAQNAS